MKRFFIKTDKGTEFEMMAGMEMSIELDDEPFIISIQRGK